MTSRAVVSVAFGDRYVRVLQRLVQSLDAVKFSGKRVTWKEDLPPGSQPHLHQPYAFKIHALAHASKTASSLLWLDSSCVARRSLDGVFDLIEQRGVLLFANPPHNVGEWCSDRALPLLGFADREEAMLVPMCWGGIVGVDMTNPTAQWFLWQWRAYADAGAFAGPKSERWGKASEDARVKGHRHDQTAASVIARRMEIQVEPMGELLACAPDEATIVIDKHGTRG